MCKSTQQDKIEMAEFPPSSLQPLAQEVVELLKARRETVSVAETVRSLPVSAEPRASSDLSRRPGA